MKSRRGTRKCKALMVNCRISNPSYSYSQRDEFNETVMGIFLILFRTETYPTTPLKGTGTPGTKKELENQFIATLNPNPLVTAYHLL